VYKRLRERGYEVFAVSPNADQVEGDPCYPDLRSIPGGVEAVVIGTRPETAEATLLAWLLAGRSQATAMLFAITVMVITCPDTLGLAAPTAIMVGTGLGARRGILFKNALALETSARNGAVVMDKTGTLTKGEPEVTDLLTDGMAKTDVLRLVAAIERECEHPLAQAAVSYAQANGVGQAKADDFEAIPGQGVIGRVDGGRWPSGTPGSWNTRAQTLAGLPASAANSPR
jgi:cation transport ATPase